jgi:hypothetical protein
LALKQKNKRLERVKLKNINKTLLKSRKMVMALYADFVASLMMVMPVYASGTTDISSIIDSVVGFLSWGVGGIGGFLAIFGIVTLGIGFSGDNASEKQKGIIGLVGGIIVIGAAILIGTIGSTLISAPTF